MKESKEKERQIKRKNGGVQGCAGSFCTEKFLKVKKKNFTGSKSKKMVWRVCVISTAQKKF